ncbi:MAG: DUF2062 domain-containing protein [Myxococcales bacterium]|nr:DUF2062 domain-containing protein [Myxococcota bacterium]MDW8281185.1 DUF2062 domain-containing protein [Myxococcales bacterium]
MATTFRARLRAWVQLLLHEHTSPGRVAAGVLLGCVVGCTPLFGLHLPLCVLLALLLRLNKLVVYGAANLSVPPVVPLLGLLSIETGELILHGRFIGLELAALEREPLALVAGRFFAAWMLGGVVVGTALGLVAGGAVYGVLVRRRAAAAKLPPERPPRARELTEALQRAARRYAGLRPGLRHYARFKYRLDPCYRAIAARLEPGAQLVDLGTGLAMLPVLLGELGVRAVGIEWDQDKVRAGQQAAAGLDGVEVRWGDVRTAPIPPCDAVALVDVLHYYEADVQRALLERAAAALRPGGQLFLREGDAARSGGARWTRLLERLAVRLGWNRGPAVRFRPADSLVAELQALGLSVERTEMAGRLHPGNVLLIGRRTTG